MSNIISKFAFISILEMVVEREVFLTKEFLGRLSMESLTQKFKFICLGSTTLYLSLTLITHFQYEIQSFYIHM